MSLRSGHEASNYYLWKKYQKMADMEIAKKSRAEINLTPSQQVLLRYHNDLSKRIPRAEITNHLEFIKKHVPTAMVAGSYRRGLKISSDIDVLVRESLNVVVERLKAMGYIKAVISAGDKRFIGVVKLPTTTTHRHIDIVFTTPRAYPFALLYFTGSKKNNILMRITAKRKGLKLNQYGLWKGLDLVPGIKTERDIFKVLGKAYLPPEDR
jgi:DNA polymerase IV